MKPQHFLFFLLSLLLSSLSWAQVPPNLRIDYVGYSGSGCPQGTVRTAFAPDNSAVSFLFDQYAVRAQNSTARANCTVRFMLLPPRNYQLRVARIEYRGAVMLGAGAQAQLKSNVMQQNGRVARTISDTTHNFQGPLNDLLYADSGTGAVWWPCNGVAGFNFIFKSELNLMNPTSDEATVSVDSADASVGATFYLDWHKCG
jgi:hypothetical protein